MHAVLGGGTATGVFAEHAPRLSIAICRLYPCGARRRRSSFPCTLSRSELATKQKDYCPSRKQPSARVDAGAGPQAQWCSLGRNPGGSDHRSSRLVQQMHRKSPGGTAR